MRRLKPLCTSVKRTTRPQIGRGLDIQHLIIASQLRRIFLNTEIEGQCQKGGNEAGDGEGREGFVETADHDAGVVVPGDGRAAVAEGPAEVPGEEGEAQNPEDEQGEIGEEVVFGIQGEGEVEEGSCREGDYSQDGDEEEL